MNKTFFFLIIFTSISLFSCKTDEVAEVEKVDLRAEISLESGWDVVQNDETDPEFGEITYHCTISKDETDDTKIIISKFHNIEEAKVSAVMYEGDRIIQITEQTLEGTNTTVAGTGTITSTYQRIEWNYTANGAQVTAVFTPGTVTKVVK